MDKKVWIGSIVLIVLVIIIVIAYPGLYPSSKTKVETLSNVTELYSFFTPYMEDFVDSYLEVMNCQPNQYYYAESHQACFICGEFDVCYGHAWVNRNGVKLMNPTELFLAGDYDYKNLLNLYSYGVADALNCNCVDEQCLCENGITASITDPGDNFIFPENLDIETEVENIAESMEKDECETISNGTQIKCGDLVAINININEVSFGKW